MNSGIYCIRNIINGKRYIGSAEDLLDRKDRHFKSLNRCDHKNKLLQEDYSKFGKENFVFEIIETLEYFETDECNHYFCDRENYWMDYFKTYIPKFDKEFGYNHKRATRVKIKNKISSSINQKGNKLSKETRIKMSKSKMGEKNSFYGKKHTDETKKSIGDKNRGKKRTEEYKQKLIQKQLKLNKKQLLEIKQLILEPTDEILKVKLTRIGNIYGISESLVGRIRNGKHKQYTPILGGGYKEWTSK